MAATDERAIHEFPTGTIDDNSLLIMDRPTATPGEYETEKFAIANLGLKLLGGIDFPSNLDTDEQDIFGAINEVNAKAMNIAAEYDETASYSKGDYCVYQNATYRCIKDPGTTTGTFVAADWTQIKALAEVKANTDEIDLKQNATDNSLATTDKTIVGAINELNSGKQDTLSVVDLTNTIRLTSNCTVQHGYVSKYGRIIDFGLVIKVTGNINNNDVIIYGLPRAINNCRCPRGLNTNEYFANDYTSGGLAIDTDENNPTLAIVRNFSNITATTSSPKYIYMNFSYLTMH